MDFFKYKNEIHNNVLHKAMKVIAVPRLVVINLVICC